MSDVMGLEAASRSIVDRHEPVAYVEHHIKPVTFVASIGSVDLDSLTCLYMVPDYADPRLHKADITGRPVTAEVAERDIKPYMEYPVDRNDTSNPDGLGRIAWLVRAACEELEETEADRGQPFQILGLSAIYLASHEINTFVYQFYSRRFLQALSNQIDDMPDIDGLPDTYWQQSYANESEHDLDLPPLEVWRQQIKDNMRRRAEAGESLEMQAAIRWTQLLLLPAEATPPTLNAQLFEGSDEADEI